MTASMKGIYRSSLRTELTHLSSGTTIYTDAPVDNQGKGQSFSPTDLLTASLASCMMTIIGIAAKTHGFNIDQTHYEITKIMSSQPRKVAKIKIELFFPNTYSEHDQAVIEQITKTCPVALSLHPELTQEVIIHYGCLAHPT
jgi:putative redox protein